VSERHVSEIKQLRVATGMIRKHSYYLLWTRSRHRAMACSHQVT